MLHARLVMVEATRDQALLLNDKLKARGFQAAIEDNFDSPVYECVLVDASIRKRCHVEAGSSGPLDHFVYFGRITGQHHGKEASILVLGAGP